MSRTHVQMMYGELAPGGTDSYVVPAGTKVLVSSMVLSAEIPAVPVQCSFKVRINPAGGTPTVVSGAILDTADLPNPYPLREPWFVLLTSDVIELENTSIVGGPNLGYFFSGIKFDPP